MASNSPLVDQVIRINPKCYARPKNKVNKKQTPHHAAAVNVSAKSIVAGWEKRGSVSANYIIESNGRCTLVVDECNRAYTSCSGSNDGQAVTIEIVNCKGAPYWEVSDAAVKKYIMLAVDICKRNGMPGLAWTGNKNGTLTNHWMFASTACCGPYLKALMPWIATEITARVQGLKVGDIVIPKVTFPAVKKQSSTTTTKKNTTTTVSKPAAIQGHIFNGVNLDDVFDAAYYASRYADLKNAFGTNDSMLFMHFCQCGMKEGRQAKADFNPRLYKERYEDLSLKYDYNWMGYYAHYCLAGKKEGRVAA